MLFPGGPVPDLDVVADTRDDYLAAEARVPEERRRKHHPALLVELGLGGSREHVAAHLARRFAERAEALQLGAHKGIPVVAGEHKETTVESARHDDLALERLAELGREGESVLVVEGVLVFAE